MFTLSLSHFGIFSVLFHILISFSVVIISTWEQRHISIWLGYFIILYNGLIPIIFELELHTPIEPVELVFSACYNRLIKHHTFLPFIIKPSLQTDDNICTLKTQSSHVLTFSWCYLFFDEWIFDSISVGYYRFISHRVITFFSCAMIYDVISSVSISFIKNVLKC